MSSTAAETATMVCFSLNWLSRQAFVGRDRRVPAFFHGIHPPERIVLPLKVDTPLPLRYNRLVSATEKQR